MANIQSDAERITEINQELDRLERERQKLAKALRIYSVEKLLELCDAELGAHGLRGTGPRTKPRATNLIARLVDARLPVKSLERERKRLIERSKKGETE